MESEKSAAKKRGLKRKYRVRRHLDKNATASHRLCVQRSIRYTGAQIIDRETNSVVFGISSQNKTIRAMKGDKKTVAKEVGKQIAEEAKKRGISQVVFDRGAAAYHGRVRSLAEGAREAGLTF